MLFTQLIQQRPQRKTYIVETKVTHKLKLKMRFTLIPKCIFVLSRKTMYPEYIYFAVYVTAKYSKDKLNNT